MNKEGYYEILDIKLKSNRISTQNFLNLLTDYQKWLLWKDMHKTIDFAMNLGFLFCNYLELDV